VSRNLKVVYLKFQSRIRKRRNPNENETKKDDIQMSSPGFENADIVKMQQEMEKGDIQMSSPRFEYADILKFKPGYAYPDIQIWHIWIFYRWNTLK
jgi:hypothetical protein